MDDSGPKPAVPIHEIADDRLKEWASIDLRRVGMEP